MNKVNNEELLATNKKTQNNVTNPRGPSYSRKES